MVFKLWYYLSMWMSHVYIMYRGKHFWCREKNQLFHHQEIELHHIFSHASSVPLKCLLFTHPCKYTSKSVTLNDAVIFSNFLNILHFIFVIVGTQSKQGWQTFYRVVIINTQLEQIFEMWGHVPVQWRAKFEQMLEKRRQWVRLSLFFRF